MQRINGQTHRVPPNRQWFNQSSVCKINIVWHRYQISCRHRDILRKCPFAWGHGNDLAAGTKIFSARLTSLTCAAGYQWIDCDALAVARSANNNASCFMSQYQWCGATFVMAKIGVHIRPTNANRRYFNQMITRLSDWVAYVTKLQCFWTVIHQSFHFAVNPPSTINTCPVT